MIIDLRFFQIWIVAGLVRFLVKLLNYFIYRLLVSCVYIDLLRTVTEFIEFVHVKFDNRVPHVRQSSVSLILPILKQIPAVAQDLIFGLEMILLCGD